MHHLLIPSMGEASPQRFAVEGNQPALAGLGQTGCPVDEADLEGGRIDFGEDSAFGSGTEREYLWAGPEMF